MVGPSGGGTEDGFTVSEPNSPCCSPSIPAVKKSVFDDAAATPRPNSSAQTHGILICVPPASVTVPRNSPESKSKALMEPSPKLPTNNALLNFAKPSKGAQAIPHGEFS